MMIFAVFCYLISIVGAAVIGWNRGYVLGEEEAFRNHAKDSSKKRHLDKKTNGQMDKPHLVDERMGKDAAGSA